MIASQNKEFTEFWSRVCKLSGATVRLIKTQSDITKSQNHYLLTYDEFPHEIKLKAEHLAIPIVSTVWIVQCLILGKLTKPDLNNKLTQNYDADDY